MMARLAYNFLFRKPRYYSFVLMSLEWFQCLSFMKGLQRVVATNCLLQAAMS